MHARMFLAGFAFCVKKTSGPDAAGQTVNVDYTKFTNNSFRLNSGKPLWTHTHTHTHPKGASRTSD